MKLKTSITRDILLGNQMNFLANAVKNFLN